ncbi:MAG: hypothetical protein F6K35_25100 [Okeania sp. SIO2H7]|nr:hypothetical protein [Okeania sp. SIO2H7]
MISTKAIAIPNFILPDNQGLKLLPSYATDCHSTSSKQEKFFLLVNPLLFNAMKGKVNS